MQMRDIRVFLSDRAMPLLPPYASPLEKLLIKEWLKPESSVDKCFRRRRTMRYFLAGGGNRMEFARLGRQSEAQGDRMLLRMKRREFFETGGFRMYLISCRKRRGTRPTPRLPG